MSIKLRLELLKQKWRNKFLRFFGLPTSKSLKEQHTELMYFSSLNEMKRNFNINIPLYPFGAAANSSLLYLICRALTTYEFKNVLEFGCGQSTLLIDSLIANTKANFDITTFEDNKFWMEEVQKQVNHKITHSELKEKTIHNKLIRFYDFESSMSSKKFDFIIVDGPKGTKRFSRFGAIEVIPEHLADEFLIIFDDAERKGEMQTYLEVINKLNQKGIKFHTRRVAGVKHQFIVASDKYQGVCFY